MGRARKQPTPAAEEPPPPEPTALATEADAAVAAPDGLVGEFIARVRRAQGVTQRAPGAQMGETSREVHASVADGHEASREMLGLLKLAVIELRSIMLDLPEGDPRRRLAGTTEILNKLLGALGYTLVNPPDGPNVESCIAAAGESAVALNAQDVLTRMLEAWLHRP